MILDVLCMRSPEKRSSDPNKIIEARWFFDFEAKALFSTALDFMFSKVPTLHWLADCRTQFCLSFHWYTLNNLKGIGKLSHVKQKVLRKTPLVWKKIIWRKIFPGKNRKYIYWYKNDHFPEDIEGISLKLQEFFGFIFTGRFSGWFFLSVISKHGMFFKGYYFNRSN